MSYAITSQGDTIESYVVSCVVDKLTDIETLPTDWKSGSSALCLEDSSVWMLGVNKLWKEI